MFNIPTSRLYGDEATAYSHQIDWRIKTVYSFSCLYLEDHILLNLLNELWKSNKMRGLPSILSLFRNEFNKFNTTGAQI